MLPGQRTTRAVRWRERRRLRVCLRARQHVFGHVVDPVGCRVCDRDDGCLTGGRHARPPCMTERVSPAFHTVLRPPQRSGVRGFYAPRVCPKVTQTARPVAGVLSCPRESSTPRYATGSPSGGSSGITIPFTTQRGHMPGSEQGKPDLQALGRCPRCATQVPQRAVLIQYGTGGDCERTFAECPGCAGVIHPEQ